MKLEDKTMQSMESTQVVGTIHLRGWNIELAELVVDKFPDRLERGRVAVLV